MVFFYVGSLEYEIEEIDAVNRNFDTLIDKLSQ